MSRLTRRQENLSRRAGRSEANPRIMPRPERIGGTVPTRGKRTRIIIRAQRRLAAARWSGRFRGSISAIPGTKDESNTSNFNDGNGARTLARSRVVWESRLWVQRFAIITFRACRFVCINSVRQFPLCGVPSSQRRVRERESSLPLALLACLPRAARWSPFWTNAKLHGSASRLYPPFALMLMLERTSMRSDPFQEGSPIQESVNALTFPPLSLFPSFLSIAQNRF